MTELPGPRSRELESRRREEVAAGVSSATPVDVVGSALVDLSSGVAVVGVGHAAPSVVDQASAQAARLTHSCFMVSLDESYVAVCEALKELTPGSHEKRSALFGSGADAVENAVTVARRATGRHAVAVFDHAHHGRTNLTMALTAKNMPYEEGSGPFAPENYRAPMSYPYRDPETVADAEAAQRATTMIESRVGADNVACVVVDPIRGEGGFVAPARLPPALSASCGAHGVLLAADEIQTGLARTGDWFACDDGASFPTASRRRRTSPEASRSPA